MNGSQKIVFADPHECLLLGVQSLIGSSGMGLEVAGFAHDETELMQMAAGYQPQIIVTDIQSPLLDGVEGLKKFIEKFPGICIIAFTGHEEIYTIYQLVHSGIKGCVSKNSSKEELLLAIQSVMEGEEYYCPIVRDRLNQFKKEDCNFNELQLEILYHLSLEKNDAEIGAILYKSPRTIEHHRERIKEKLRVKSNLGLIKVATARGYISRIFTGVVAELSFFDDLLFTLFA